MSRAKSYAPSNTYDIPPLNKVKAIVKEEVVELLGKHKIKCGVVISTLEEDRDNASNRLTLVVYS